MAQNYESPDGEENGDAYGERGLGIGRRILNYARDAYSSLLTGIPVGLQKHITPGEYRLIHRQYAECMHDMLGGTRALRDDGQLDDEVFERIRRDAFRATMKKWNVREETPLGDFLFSKLVLQQEYDD